MRLLLRVQFRSFFPHVYFGIAAATIAMFHLLVPAEEIWWVLPSYLFAEPAIVALSLVGAQAFLERGEGTVTALAVTPLRSGEYVVSLVLTSAVLASLAGIAVQAGVVGVDQRLAYLALPLFATTLLTGFIGLAISAYFTDFTRFLVGGMVPAVVLLQAPFAAWFELLPRPALAWIPTDPALFAIANAARRDPDVAQNVLYCALLIAYAVAAFFWARFAFERRMARLESI